MTYKKAGEFAMIARPKLPSYNVEFLPLERRFLDRREIIPPLSFLVHEKRYFVRRQEPSDTSNAGSLAY